MAAAVLSSAWQTAQVSTLLWGWVLLPAALAGLAARLYPGLALQLTRAYQVPHPAAPPAWAPCAAGLCTSEATR